MGKLLGVFWFVAFALLAACGDDGEVVTRAAPTASATVTTTTTVTPTPTPTPCFPICEDGALCSPIEQCDDGNNFGGDGCAANCTLERGVTCDLGIESGSQFQTSVFVFPLVHTGFFDFQAGSETPLAVDTGSQGLARGDVPLALPVAGIRFEPILIPGIGCTCIRGAAGEFGPGNAGSGVIGCGDAFEAIDLTSEIDHNTNDVDPQCTNGVPDSMRPEVCNGRRRTSAAGRGPRGSSVLQLGFSLDIRPSGTCNEQCIPANGPDCLPCTDDDPDQAPPTFATYTTGRASAHIYDADNVLGRELGCGIRCGEAPCACALEGRPFDCEALERGVLDGAWVAATPILNGPGLGDAIVTTRLDCSPP